MEEELGHLAQSTGGAQLVLEGSAEGPEQQITLHSLQGLRDIREHTRYQGPPPHFRGSTPQSLPPPLNTSQLVCGNAVVPGPSL